MNYPLRTTTLRYSSRSGTARSRNADATQQPLKIFACYQRYHVRMGRRVGQPGHFYTSLPEDLLADVG